MICDNQAAERESEKDVDGEGKNRIGCGNLSHIEQGDAVILQAGQTDKRKRQEIVM